MNELQQTQQPQQIDDMQNRLNEIYQRNKTLPCNTVNECVDKETLISQYMVDDNRDQ